MLTVGERVAELMYQLTCAFRQACTPSCLKAKTLPSFLWLQIKECADKVDLPGGKRGASGGDKKTPAKAPPPTEAPPRSSGPPKKTAAAAASKVKHFINTVTKNIILR